MTATAVPISTTNGVVRMKIDASFISSASIFLPRYSGVRPIISPAMNTPRMANISIEYMPVPTPPGASSPSCIRNSGTKPPSGVIESCIVLTAPRRGGGGDRREQRRGGDAEARLLALHVAARLGGARDLVDALLRDQRIAVLLAAVSPASTSGTNRISIAARTHPALPGVADHLAEGVGQRERDDEDREHLEQVRQRRRDSHRDAPNSR